MAPRKLKTSEVAQVRKETLESQGGICPLCVERIEKPALDHCHSKGHIRGVLCLNCNQMEGRIRGFGVRARRHLRYVEWLANLLAYVVEHESDRTGLIHPTHKTPEEKKANAAKKRRAKKP
jgi:hypothetical protein